MAEGMTNVQSDITSNISEWDAVRTYQANDICKMSGKLWVSRRNGNLNQTPSRLSTWWYEHGHFILYDRQAQNTDSSLRPYAFGKTGGLQHLATITISDLIYANRTNWNGVKLYCSSYNLALVVDIPFLPWRNSELSATVPITDHNDAKWSYTLGGIIGTNGTVSGRFFAYSQETTGGTIDRNSGDITINRVELY